MPKCDQCGICCKFFLINLNEAEYLTGKYRTVNDEYRSFVDFTEVEKYGLNFLAQNKDGSCVYLQENGCSIHEIRPQVCRDFFCSSRNLKYSTMITMINDFKHRNR